MNNIFKTKFTKGFTLIELIVVIAIIGLLATVVLASLNTAREKAKIGKAVSELRQIRNAIALLESDTGKWPNGCPPSQVADPEVALNMAQAGINLPPTVQNNGSGCQWVGADIASWKGSYMDDLFDPWGNTYYFDPDYHQYENCASMGASNKYPTIPEFVAALSSGPDGLGDGTDGTYGCDDIFLKL